jgi:GNAT superfamily N-acetyltransferase
MNKSDMESAIKLTEDEKWYLTEFDLELYLNEGQGMGTVAVADGVTVGIATAAIYGSSAWIGNVIVTPSLRNLGIGRKLVEAHIDLLRENGIRTYLLYAYDRSKSLYERMGFRFDAKLWEIVINRLPSLPETDVSHGYDKSIEEVDSRFFPCSRKNVLIHAARRKGSDVITHRDRKGNVDGYLFAVFVDNEYGSEVAPFICKMDDIATMLGASGVGEGVIHLYVPEENIDAVERLGVPFQRVRRMHRGYIGSPDCLPNLGPEVISAGFLETG